MNSNPIPHLHFARSDDSTGPLARADIPELVRASAVQRMQTLTRQLDALFAEREALLPLVKPPDVDKGMLLGVRARSILTETGPLAYRDLLQEFYRRGYPVGGKNPAATLLTTLHREPGVERVGKSRSGIWQAIGGQDGS